LVGPQRGGEDLPYFELHCAKHPLCSTTLIGYKKKNSRFILKKRRKKGKILERRPQNTIKFNEEVEIGPSFSKIFISNEANSP
jgi:hypothetical protein